MANYCRWLSCVFTVALGVLAAAPLSVFATDGGNGEPGGGGGDVTVTTGFEVTRWVAPEGQAVRAGTAARAAEASAEGTEAPPDSVGSPT